MFFSLASKVHRFDSDTLHFNYQDIAEM